MTDRQVLILAVAASVAASVPVGVVALGGLRWLLAVAALLAWRWRRPLALIAALVIFAWLNAGVAWQGAQPLVEARELTTVASLVADPEPGQAGVRVRAEVDGVVADLSAYGGAAGLLRPRLMGERVEVTFRIRPLDNPPRWLIAQGVQARGTVLRVGGFDEGAVHTRVANSLRRTIESGAASLGRDQRSLFTGLVYGDDRAQSPLVADDFAGAGLTHLLAVSGQNVAFVLAIFGPLLRRLDRRGRYGVVAVVLFGFATMTRFEASVVRASVMAAIAATGALVGTSVGSRRVLGLAITALVLARPLLVWSLAFQLSVAASAGILAWSGRLARAIPGPRPLVDALAVTATAQAAVAPLLLWHFDGVPVASLPANVAAAPAAGPVMMWGMTAGWVAGLVPAWLAEVLHLPTRLGVWWIGTVAAWCSMLPLGSIGVGHLVAVVVAAAFGLAQRQTARRVGAAALVVAVLAAPGISLATRTPTSARLDSGTVLLRDPDETMVVLGDGRPEQVLADLRESAVGRIDLLVVPHSSYSSASLVGWIESRHDVAEIWAPEPTLGRGERVPNSTDSITVAGFDLRASIVEDRLVLHRAPPPVS